MQFTIYSIGDSEFLEQVLIAVAMLMNHGEVKTAVMVSALIAILLTGFSSMANGGKEFNVSSIIVGFIFFLAFFVPKTTVLIEDTSTGQIRVVDNVPIAIGASGGIISALGYGIGELFEQGYSTTGTDLSNDYFSESLVILTNLRKKTYNNHVLTAISEDTSSEFANDLNNYVNNCLAPAMTFKEIDAYKAGVMNIFELFKEGSISANSHGTKISTNLSGGYELPTCSVAHNLLVNRLNTAITSGVKTRQALGSSAQQLGPALLKSAGIDQSNQLMVDTNNALQSLNISSVSAQQYIQAIILDGALLDGLDTYYASSADYTNRNMVRQAIEQRNTQWATEQSLFLSTVRPLQAFFEAFVYAIAPFIAILLVAGKVGYGLASKYLLSLIWIQLWFPMLSIIKMFIYIGTAREFRQYSSEGGTELLSFYGLNSANQIAQDWAATGGMLAASTPVIALFLVTGSVYTMNSIAGRMSGSAHVDPKQASPDVRNSPPVLQSSAHSEGDPSRGVIKTGLSSLLSNFNMGQIATNNETSSETQMQSAQVSFGQNYSNAIYESLSDRKSSGFARQIGSHIRSSNDRSYAAINNLVSGISEALNLNTGQQQMLAARISADAAAGIRITPAGAVKAAAEMFGEEEGQKEAIEAQKGQEGSGQKPSFLSRVSNALKALDPSLSLGLSGSSSKSGELSSGVNEQFSKRLDESASEINSNSAAISMGLSNAINENEEIGNSYDKNSLIGNALTRSSQDLQSSTLQYDKSRQLNSALGNTKSIDGRTFAESMIRHYDGNFAELQQGLTPSENQKINQRARNLAHHAGIPLPIAQAYSIAEHLSNNHPDKFADMAYQMFNHSQGEGSSSDNSNLSSIKFGNNKQAVQSAPTSLNIPSPLQDIRKQKIGSNFNDNNVWEDYLKGVSGVEFFNNQNQTKIATAKAEHGINNLINSNPGLNPIAQSMDKLDDAVSEFLSNPTGANAMALARAVTPVGALMSVATKNEGVALAMDYATSVAGRTLGEAGLGKLQESLQSGFGNGQQMVNYAQGQLGLTNAQAKYFSALSANFSGEDPLEARQAVEKEAYENAYNSLPYEAVEDRSAVATKYAASVVSTIREASQYGEIGASAITAPLRNVNKDLQTLQSQRDIWDNALESNTSSNASEGQRNNGFFLTETSNRSGGSMQLPSQAMYSPVEGARVSSEFNERRVRSDGSVYHHGGIDFAAPKGTPIYSTEAGVVTRTAYDKNGYGHYAMIDHGNGLSTLYAHMPNTNMVEKGQRVEAGEQIGVVGNTGTSSGPHLHFEVVNNNLMNDGKWGESKFEPRPYLANVLR